MLVCKMPCLQRQHMHHSVSWTGQDRTGLTCEHANLYRNFGLGQLGEELQNGNAVRRTDHFTPLMSHWLLYISLEYQRKAEKTQQVFVTIGTTRQMQTKLSQTKCCISKISFFSPCLYMCTCVQSVFLSIPLRPMNCDLGSVLANGNWQACSCETTACAESRLDGMMERGESCLHPAGLSIGLWS